jgi:hypothetical protein
LPDRDVSTFDRIRAAALPVLTLGMVTQIGRTALC